MTLVIFQTRKEQNKSKFKEKIQYILFYIPTKYLNLYELVIAEYLAYGIAVTRNGYNSKWPDTNFAVFSYYKVST